ncbi:hypothetical protein HOD29_06350 [archaeon]|jgi:hypothetical protein|nr:hypothetical protein [archaeon]
MENSESLENKVKKIDFNFDFSNFDDSCDKLINTRTLLEDIEKDIYKNLKPLVLNVAKYCFSSNIGGVSYETLAKKVIELYGEKIKFSDVHHTILNLGKEGILKESQATSGNYELPRYKDLLKSIKHIPFRD